MRSWRDTTPELVQADLDGVAAAAFDAAETFIAKRGEFFPFAITVDNEGDIHLVAAGPGLGEHPASLAVLDFLYATAAAERDTHRAVGFVADVKVDGGDAVRVEVEHRDGGPPLVLQMPYRRTGLLKKAVRYGQMTVSEGTRRIWDGS